MPQTTNLSNKSLNPGTAYTGNIPWVPGLNGVRNWKMYPNTIDILMDNVNQGIYYIKACDETGAMKPLRAFKYEEISLEDVPLQDVDTPALGNFVTKDDFSAFKEEMIAAIKSLNQNQNHYKKKQNYNGGNQQNERT